LAIVVGKGAETISNGPHGYEADIPLMKNLLDPLHKVLPGLLTAAQHCTILWHFDPLLGSDREISNYTTTIAR
jgi:hypothetical protein